MTLNNARIITAMVTPFDEAGQIDFNKLPALVEHLLSHHSEGLVLAGTTGESPTLTHDEEMQLFHEVIRLVDGRVPLLCGVGTNDTRDTVAFVQEVAKIQGVAAGLCVVPYYNKPSQEGLYQHFKTIAECSDLPIILYNVPGRTVAKLELETIVRLSQLKNIIGIKECTDVENIALIVENTPADFLVYSGDDAVALPAKVIGGQGIISVASHVLGDEMYEMYQALEAGEIQQAASIYRKFVPKAQVLFSVPSPAPVKTVLNAAGIPVGGLRLPLVACNPQEEANILAVLAE